MVGSSRRKSAAQQLQEGDKSHKGLARLKALAAKEAREAGRPIVAEFQLERLQELRGAYRQCKDIVEREGVTTTNTRGEVRKHPAVTSMVQYAAAILALERELALLPDDKPKPGDFDPLELLLNGEDGDDGAVMGGRKRH